MDSVIENLSLVEAAKLENAETTIGENINMVVQAGRFLGDALRRIRDDRLYRATHPTFEDYCQERWNIGRRHVNRYIALSDVQENLGQIDPNAPMPNQSQAAELAKLPKDQQADAWARNIQAPQASRDISFRLRCQARSTRK